MTHGTLIRNREHALAWVNALRTEWGLKPITELRRGLPAGPEECSLANSLSPIAASFCNDGTYLVATNENGVWIEHELPEPVATFEHDFERGYYPDLIEAWFADEDDHFYGPKRVDRPTAIDAPV